MLTYDEELNTENGCESIYAPGTTWAEGRNILLNRAKSKQPNGYEFYVLFDDDVVFLTGTFKDFIFKLKKDKPDFAVPLCDIIEKSGRYNKSLSTQKPIAFDQVVQAYSKKAVNESIAVPYATEYDE